MNGQGCDNINLKLQNLTDEKVTANIFDVSNNEVSLVADGKLFNTSEGAGSGVQLPTIIVNSAVLNKTTNFYFVSTQSGIWVYDITNDIGSLITTSTSVTGDALPDNHTVGLSIDETNNILFVATVSGVWKYNISTNTGTAYTTASGVSAGDNLPANNTAYLVFDSNNNRLFASSALFLWQLDINTNTGLDLTTVPFGDNYPTGTNNTIHYDLVNDLLFVGLGGGINRLYQYNPATTTGKIFSTIAGAGSGDQMPSGIVTYQITQIGNSIYVPTYNTGIWIYNIATDTGSLLNTLTSVTGEALPDNIVYTCKYVSDNDKLYVSSGNKLWSLVITSNTGEIEVAASGDSRPATYSTHFDYYNQRFFEVMYATGVWSLSEVAYTISSSTSENLSYDFVLQSLKANPILVNKIIFYSANENQKLNNLKQVVNTIYGDSVEYQVQIQAYQDPVRPDNKIHIDLNPPIQLSVEEFFQMDLEAQTSVSMLFEYCPNYITNNGKNDAFSEYEQLFYDNNIQNAVIGSGGGSIKAIDTVANQPKQKKSYWPWLLLAISGFIIYKTIKNKKK